MRSLRKQKISSCSDSQGSHYDEQNNNRRKSFSVHRLIITNDRKYYSAAPFGNQRNRYGTRTFCCGSGGFTSRVDLCIFPKWKFAVFEELSQATKARSPTKVGVLLPRSSGQFPQEKLNRDPQKLQTGTCCGGGSCTRAPSLWDLCAELLHYPAQSSLSLYQKKADCQNPKSATVRS